MDSEIADFLAVLGSLTFIHVTPLPICWDLLKLDSRLVLTHVMQVVVIAVLMNISILSSAFLNSASHQAARGLILVKMLLILIDIWEILETAVAFVKIILVFLLSSLDMRVSSLSSIHIMITGMAFEDCMFGFEMLLILAQTFY